MKYILSILMVLAVLGTANAQNETIERAGYYSILTRNHKITKMLSSIDYAIEMDKKFHRRMNTGLVFMGVGAGLMATAANYDVPVYGVGQDDVARRLDRERGIFLWSGVGLSAIGTFLAIDSFKFHRRAQLDLSATGFRVKYSLGL